MRVSGTAQLPDSAKISLCDLEQIQFLGRIQPFAALIEVSSNWTITRVSANLAEFLPIAAEAAIGQPLADVLGRHATHQIRGLLQAAARDPGVQSAFNVRNEPDCAAWDIAVHRLDDNAVIELERHDPSGEALAAAVPPLLMQLRNLPTLDRLCAQVTRQLRALSGFDRVMVYQFHPDGSGEVIAERKSSNLPPFLGLRYPASDIPKQARALYLRNPLRLIADVGAPPVPIIPASDEASAPLDLSLALSRAVSPTHIEYLHNMGVGASMSISIVMGGKLWGLICCHHRTPHTLSMQCRTALGFFGHMLSTILETLMRPDEAAREQALRAVREAILSAVNDETAELEDVVPQLCTVKTLLSADGMACFVDGRLRLFGTTPSEPESLALVQFLCRLGLSRIYSTSALASVYPEAAAYIELASGILAVPVSRKLHDFVVFFRREIIQRVVWGGDPAKGVAADADGRRPSPRSNFDAMRQTIVGQSAPWTDADHAIGEALRVILIEFMLQITDRAERRRKASNEQQDLLIAELNHRVRNILNLIVGLVRQCGERATSVAALTKEISVRVHALARAHDQLTSGGWGARSVMNMIRIEAGAYLGDKADRVLVTGADIYIMPDAFVTLALVIHELITNAAKYGALSDSHGRVAIALERDGAGCLVIDWREFGGRPVREPARRGFGSTIIERAIPHELGGNSAIRFDVEGVKARLAVPARYLADEVPAHASASKAADSDAARAKRIDGVVLLVEDNLLIALETEESLYTIGAADVHIASTVAAALTFLQDARPNFAVLDYNLGREQSVAIADRLIQEAVPFVFATGYGDSATIDRRFRDHPIISKPYSARSLLDAFNAAMA